jgi:hypothetical protein
MAATQMDNLSGSWSKLGATWDGIMTSGWFADSLQWIVDFTDTALKSGFGLKTLFTDNVVLAEDFAKTTIEAMAALPIGEKMKQLENGLQAANKELESLQGYASYGGVDWQKQTTIVEMYGEELIKTKNIQKELQDVSIARSFMAQKSDGELIILEGRLTNQIAELRKEANKLNDDGKGFEVQKLSDIYNTRVQIAAINAEIKARRELASTKVAEVGGDSSEVVKSVLKDVKFQTNFQDAADEEVRTTREVSDEKMYILTAEEQFKLEQFNREKDAARQKADEEIALAEEVSERKKELQSELLNESFALTEAIGQAIFDVQKEKLEDETEAINEEYDKRLANEQLSTEQRDLLEAEKQKKLNEIKKKQRAIEKKEFLFQQGMKAAEIIMNTGVAIMKNTATLGLLPAIPVNVLTAVLGGVQLATVLAQSIPKFDKGTKSTPNTFIAGEKGNEIMMRNGRAELIDKPTLFSGNEYKGAEIISTAETARLLQNQMMNKIMSPKDMGSMVNDQTLLTLKKINQSINKQKMSVKVNASNDIRSTIWYKNIRN